MQIKSREQATMTILACIVFIITIGVAGACKNWAIMPLGAGLFWLTLANLLEYYLPNERG
jgi:hypothetical protein